MDSLPKMTRSLMDQPESGRQLLNGRSHHKWQTPRCLSLSRLDPKRSRSGWTLEDQAHVTGCRYCQRVIALFWRQQCPSLWDLARLAGQPEGFPNRTALRFHLEQDLCKNCRELSEPPLFQRLVQNVRDWATHHAVATYASLPLSSDDSSEASTDPHEPIVEASSHTMSLILHQTDRDLLATLGVVERRLAGAQVRVAVIGRDNVEVVDGSLGQHQDRVGFHANFGPAQDLVQHLGSDFAVIAALLDSDLI